MRSPLTRIRIPITTQRIKKTFNQNSPKAILAYWVKKLMIGDSGAAILLKKNKAHKMIRENPILYLLILKLFFVECFLLATLRSLKSKT